MERFDLSTYSRTNPFLARIKDRFRLNRPGSSKETFHIELAAPISFQVGDSIAILPSNDPHAVQQLLKAAHFKGSEEVFDPRANETTTIGAYLAHKANLSKCTSSFLKMLKEKGAKGLEGLLIAENKPKLTECLQTHQLADLLKAFPGAHLSPQDLTSLLPLMPRFYSIASSPRMFPNEIHLTVGSLTYMMHGEMRRGVGSHFICHQAEIERTPIPLYVQASNGFTLPTDPDASIILIGPGTGVAPFRAFLQERLALGHIGRNWLFFGERNRASDFYYADFLLQLEKENRLRLDLAFSRDQAEKIYVQHRLWEQRASIFDWIQNGAYLYLCGDAEKMAKDVELTLHRIAKDQGSFTEDEAKAWLKNLRQTKRFLADVY
jgi:sulfite reductase (NADPH) flavoprotein alpha-component